jgi:rod shape-determining protein MreB
MTLRGRNLVTGLPESVEVSSIEVREALTNSVNTIVETVRSTLDETPPELVADLMETGIALAGGGSLLQGLVERIADETNIHTWVAEDALTCVARGAEAVLTNLDDLRQVLVGLERNSTSRPAQTSARRVA